MQLESSTHIFRKHRGVKFHENPSVGTDTDTVDGQAHRQT